MKPSAKDPNLNCTEIEETQRIKKEISFFSREKNEVSFNLVVAMPDKKKIFSFVSEEHFHKLEAFLEKYGVSDAVKWEDLAANRVAKYKRAGLALRGARYREGVSQKELAKRCKISQENISKMENGHRPMGEKVARKLARVLRIDFHLLLNAS